MTRGLLALQRNLRWCVLPSVWLCAAPAFGQEEGSDTNVSVTSTSIVDVRGDNKNLDQGGDDNYNVGIERLNVTGSAGDINVQARLDGSRFINRPTREYRSDLRLERLNFSYNGPTWQVRAGDIFRQLGRGIVLSFRKENEAGIDMALRGGEMKYISDNHEASLFGGTVNVANLDVVSQKFTEDPEDALGGAEYRFRGWDRGEAGLFGVYFDPKQNIVRGLKDSNTSVGMFLDLYGLTENSSLYIEADAQRVELGNTRSTNFAGYGALDMRFGDSQVLVESIYLDEFEMRGSANSALQSRFFYNRAPTLQRIREQLLGNQDVLAGRLKVEHYFESLELAVFANGLYRLENFDDGESEITQTHGWGGFDWTVDDEGNTTIKLTAGYRDEQQRGEQLKTLLHNNLDVLQAITDTLALHITSYIEYRSLHEVEINRFVQGSSFLSLERTGWGSVTFEFGYDTLTRSDRVRNYFYAGIVNWQVNDEIALTVTGGTQRGGIKCIAGVCREYPAFAGGRLEAVGRF